jgi:hypothetical protein
MPVSSLERILIEAKILLKEEIISKNLEEFREIGSSDGTSSGELSSARFGKFCSNNIYLDILR